MKVIDHLKNAKEPLLSFEIIPPKRGGDIESLLKVIDDISKYNPPFIDITSHAAEVSYEETSHGIQKRIKRKRPGTLGICALIQKKYNIDAVPHILCQGFTREETEDFLIELQYLEIKNVMAIRGDDKGYKKPIREGRTINEYAANLVQQISDMNSGIYLEDELLDAKSSDFCIGVSGYPEKHFESPNLEMDIEYLKKKVDAGAGYVVTQMFFDNSKYYSFVEKCRSAGINVPIIPGIKIITSKKQLTTIPRHFFVDIPAELTTNVMNAKKGEVVSMGVAWAKKQVEDLLAHNVSGIHFYIMQNSTPIKLLFDSLGIKSRL
jgi:methylenetetrahydrofolate reductase (NADPH)